MGSPAQSGPWISPWKHIAMLLVTPITAVIGLILGDLAIVLAILSVPLFIRAAILFYGLNVHCALATTGDRSVSVVIPSLHRIP